MKKRIRLAIILLTVCLLAVSTQLTAQVTIVNHTFNTGSSYALLTATTATGINTGVSGTETFTTFGGTATGASAFTNNATAGNALSMSNSSGTNTKYWTISVSGSALPNYSAFKIYFQAQRSSSGAQTITVQYSVNGGAYTTFASNTMSPGNGSFTEAVFTLPAALNNPTSLNFRLFASAAGGNGSGTGTLRLDNFQVQATSSSSSSSIISANNEATNITYATYNTASIAADGSNALKVWSFTMQDGGGSADADALATVLSAVTLTPGAGNTADWANTVKQAALFDGSTKLAEVSVTGNSIAFTGLSATAADDNSKTLDLYLSFESTVTDNQQLQFSIANAGVTAGSNSSGFSAFTAATSSVSGDNNKIEVSATDLLFDVQPTTTPINIAMSPAVTVLAVDGNANTDLDFTGTVSLATSAGSFDAGATTSVAAVSGTATFSNIIYSSTATGATLTASAAGVNDDVSSSFNITNPQPEIGLKQGATAIASGGSFAMGSVVSGNSGTATTFTIENTGNADLTLSGNPKIAISGTDAGQFSADETATAGTVTSGNSTTFTLSFNPTTTGSKSATVTITSNDADEGSYTFTITGTSTASAASDVTVKSGYTYNTNIAYNSYQATDITGGSNDIELAKFTIRDGGGSADGDNLGTTVTDLTFSLSNSAAIRRIALYDGATEIAEAAGAASVSFNGISLTAADGGEKDFSVRVSYNTTVTDNTTNVLTITAATAAASGSGLAAANAGGAATSAAGDDNKIEVTATALAFVQQPSAALVGVAMSPAVTVSANDANGNRDLDFSASVDLTSTGTLSSSPQTATAASGLATYNTITHTVTGTGLTLSASAAGVTGATSNSFNVSVQPAGVLLSEDNFNYSGVLTGNGYTTLTGSGTNNLTAGATGLTYTDYASGGLGNSLTMANNGHDVTRSFSAQAATTTVYASFLVYVTAAGTGDYFFALAPTASTSSFRARTFIKSATGGFNIGVSNAGTAVYGSSVYALNTTHLVVVKYTFNGTNSAAVSVYVNPSLYAEPGSAEATTTETSSVPADISSYAIRQGSSGQAPALRLDEIRIATNWGALLGNPQFDGSGSLAAGNYNDVTILSAGTPVMTGNVSLYGTLANSGALSIGSNTLTLKSNTTGSGTLNGSATSNLTIDGTAGTIGFTTGGATLKNLTLSTGASATLGTDLTITAGASASSFGTVTIANSAALTIAANKLLTLQSNANGTARIGASEGTLNAGGSNGQVLAERYIPSKEAWRFLASPVNTSGTIYDNWQEGGGSPAGYGTYITAPASNTGNGFDNTPTSANSMFTYTAGAGPWNGIANTNNTQLKAGTGYRLWVRSDRTTPIGTVTSATTLRATGTPVMGTVTMIPAASTPANSSELNVLAGGASQYSLVGNPYCSPVNFQNLTKTNLLDYYWAWDPNLAVTGHRDGRYVLVRGADGTTNAVGSNVGLHIQPGQAFFVRNAATGTPALVFEEADKSSTHAAVFKTTNVDGVVKIRLMEDTSFVDGAVAFYNSSYSNSITIGDAGKLSNPNENLSILRGATQLTMEERTEVIANDTIPLRLSALNAAYPYSIATEIANMGNVQGWLIDTVNNQTYPLNMSGTTSVSLPSGISGTQLGFKIVFANTTLAVHSLELRAVKEKVGHRLTWTTEGEKDMTSYAVEHSENGTDFAILHTAVSKGEGSFLYSWLHKTPATGDNYYRIRAVANDGSHSYSRTVKLNGDAAVSGQVTVFPNPVTGGSFTLALDDVAAGDYSLAIYSSNGKLVHSSLLSHSGGSQSAAVRTEKLADGVYYLVLENGSGSYRQTLTIQNN